MTGLRLDLTVRVGGLAVLAEVASTLRAAQQSVTGETRLVVLHLQGEPDRAAEAPAGPAEESALDWRSDPAHISVAVLRGCFDGWALRLAMGCDLRVMAADGRLSFAVDSRLLPDLASLVNAVGYARALELTLAERSLTAPDALAAGLVQRVAEPDRLDDEVERLAGALLTPDRDVAREVKALLLSAENRPREHQWGAQREARLRLFE